MRGCRAARQETLISGRRLKMAQIRLVAMEMREVGRFRLHFG